MLKKETDTIRISKRITQGKLDNGVSYFFMRNGTPKDRCMLRLFVATGSFNETDDERGMAHFLEHLAFDNRAISKDETLAEWFQNHGMALGADANAYTSSDHTVFQINLPHCDKKEVADALSILRNFADGLQFRDEAIAKEKNIVDAEERERENTRSKLIERSVDHLMSGTLHVSRPVLGKKEVRAKFTKDAVSAFYKKWYQPPNFTVVLVGDYGELNPKEMITSHFSAIKSSFPPQKPAKSPNPDYRHKAFIINEPELSYVETVFTIQAKKMDRPAFNRSILKERIAFDLAIAMLQNAFRLKAKEVGNTLQESLINGFMIESGVYEMTLSTFGSPEHFEEGFKESFFLLKQREEFGFLETEFQSALTVYKDRLSQWIIEEDTETSDIWTNRILDHLAKRAYANDARDYQTWIMPILESITKTDCQKALKKALHSGNQYIFALGKIENSKENIGKLKALLASAKSAKMSAEKSNEAPVFQYHVESCANLEPNLKYLKQPDVYAVDLSNNVRMVLKPTKYKSDEILITAFWNSRNLAMTERDFKIARIFSSFLLEGGLKKHDPVEIPKLVKEKSLYLTMSFQNDRLRANATTRNKDLRFTLELFRAYISDPLYAESALIRIKDQIKTNYAMLIHDMWAPLSHDYIKAITNNDYRVGRADLSDIMSITRDEMLAWHQKYITNGQLNLIAVGDFDVSHLAKEIACVFGTLPKNSTVLDRKIKPIVFKSGIHKTYEITTKDETEKIAIRYPLNFTKIPRKDHKFFVLKNIIQEVLRQKLREKKQIVYSPVVDIVMNQDDSVQNWLDIVVSVPRSQGEMVKTKILSILEKLEKRGVSERELTKAKEPYIAKMTELMKSNSFFVDLIATNFLELGSLQWVNTISPDIQAITVTEINSLLKQYLPSKNASTAVVTAIEG